MGLMLDCIKNQGKDVVNAPLDRWHMAISRI
jgi:hypothetical protein